MSVPDAGPSNSSEDSSDRPAPPELSVRNTKRKLEDAFQRLDEAVGSYDTIRPPKKKAHVARSLYSTLAKYGIKTNSSKDSPSTVNDTLSKKTPHLAAILARAASRTRQAIPLKLTARAPAVGSSQHFSSEYRPSSVSFFLARLATYKLATYANKPSAIDAVAASKCGWINDGKDRLACGICNVSWVIAGREGMSRDAANALIEKQRESLIEMHKNGCPWKTKQCDDSIYYIPLQSPAVMAKEIKSNAMKLESTLRDVKIKHPLSSTQIQALTTALSYVPSSALESSTSDDSSEAFDLAMTQQSEPSETSAVTSLFGWTLAPTEPKLPSAASLHTAFSPSFSLPASAQTSRAGTPAPGSPRPLIRMAARRDSSLLYCSLCNRRLGVWAFAAQTNTVLPGISEKDASVGINPTIERNSSQLQPAQRQFDVLKEHRSYCPYFVKSTVVPSLPVPQVAGNAANGQTSASPVSGAPSGAMEGWRSVLTVVMRYGISRRQRLRVRSAASRQADGESDVAPMDSVEAMVAGVKSKGGKELLKYIQDLLK